MPPTPNAPMDIWQDHLPGATRDPRPDLPNITPYVLHRASHPTPAVVICPGGGYGCLCDTYEGHQIAQWLNDFGFAGIVLDYRHAPFRHPVPFWDVTRTMRLVRQNATAWNIDDTSIGIMGFSAGGHLAATLATRWDPGNDKAEDPIERQPSRPDFQVLVYPVITFVGPYVHQGTRTNLVGPDASPKLQEALSAHLQVTEQTPTAFVAHSILDSMVPVQNSRLYVQALKAHGVPVEYVELTSGDHGLGCGKGPDWETWQRNAREWLLNTIAPAAHEKT